MPGTVTGPSLNVGETDTRKITDSVRQLIGRWNNPPVSITATTYNMLQSDSSIIFNATGASTIALLNAAAVAGRQLYIKTVAAQAVYSVASNIVAVNATTATSSILSATAGSWAVLQSDGANWVKVTASSTAAGSTSTGSVSGPSSTVSGDIVTWASSDGTATAESSITFATTSHYLANTSNKALVTDKVWASATLASLTDGVTVTPDFGAGINFTWTIGGARTLANPTNQKVGQTGFINIIQDATGGRTISSWGTNYKSASGVKPSLTTTTGALDVLYYAVIDSSAVLVSVVNSVS